jgi:hypothetical protein
MPLEHICHLLGGSRQRYTMYMALLKEYYSLKRASKNRRKKAVQDQVHSIETAVVQVNSQPRVDGVPLPLCISDWGKVRLH